MKRGAIIVGLLAACGELPVPAGELSTAAPEERVMALDNPPDGLVMTVGTWGTDADENLTVTRNGLRSLELKNTTPAAPPVLQREQFIEIEQGRYYWAEAWLRATSVVAGNTVRFTVRFYDADFDETHSIDITSGVLPSANVWHHVSTYFQADDANDRWAKYEFSKNNTAFAAYIGSHGFQRMQPWAEGVMENGDQSINASTETEVLFDGGQLVDIALASGRFTVPEDGFYRVDAGITFEGLSDGTRAYLKYAVNGVANRFVAMNRQISAGGDDLFLGASFEVLLEAGNALGIVAWHDDVAARNVTGGVSTDTRTYFNIRKVFP